MTTQPNREKLEIPKVFLDYANKYDVAGGEPYVYVDSMPLRDILDWHQAAVREEVLKVLKGLLENTIESSEGLVVSTFHIDAAIDRYTRSRD